MQSFASLLSQKYQSLTRNFFSLKLVSLWRFHDRNYPFGQTTKKPTNNPALKN